MSQINYKSSVQKNMNISFDDDPDDIEETADLSETTYNQSENIEKVVHKILTKMTSDRWQVVDISAHKSKGEICPICNIPIQSHTANFSCSHYCCTSCLDNLADSYNKECEDVLFECPICSLQIKNIEYH